MAKEKQTRRMIAMALAAAVAMSSMPMAAFAADDLGGGQQTSSDNGDSGDNGSGGEPSGGESGGGSAAPASENGDESGESASHIPAAPAEGEKPVVKDGPIDITISIPPQSDDPSTPDVNEGTNKVEGDPVGTVTGDTPDGPDDKEYDYEVVTQQGSVTVETTEITGTTEYGDSDLDYVSSDTKPTEDNDLYNDSAAAPEQFQPGYEQPEGETPVEGEIPVEGETPAEGEAPEDEYEFVSGDDYLFEYVGTGNTSQFRPAVVFTEPLTDEQKVKQYGDDPRNGAYIHKDYLTKYFVGWLDEEDRAKIPPKENGEYVTDENGYLLDVDGNRVLKNEWSTVGPDGKTYYLHRFDANGTGNYVEGWYNDADWVEVNGEKVYMEGNWEFDLNAGAELNANGKPITPKVPLLDKDGTPVLDDDGKPVLVNVTSAFVQVKDSNGKYIYVTNDKGEIVTSYGAVWGSAQQFVLVDKETGEVITTYCADIATKTEMGFGYNIVNLEDSTYYSDEQAKLIRAIATSGYWGTESGQGSLDAMKEMLKASGQFSDEELASLTDGVALTATQMAIWSCSNHMAGTEFINTHYGAGNVPGDKEDEVKLMFRVYEYLKGLAPVSYEGEETTANTIINADNFLKGDMEITVLEKAEDHANNQDDNDKNDAYKTKLSFALVVQPSTENGDDLVVSVVNGNGDIVAKGRVAGDGSNDDNTFTGITDHGDGNYSFDNITMIEGNQVFNITMEGIQNLKEGVYLYTSEVTTTDSGLEKSSQTMVGMANGSHSVKTSQNIEFSFDVEDEKVVVREHHSSGGGKKEPPMTPPEGPTHPSNPGGPEEDEGMVLGAEDEIVAEEEGMVAGAEENIADAEDDGIVAGDEDEIIAATADSNHMAGAGASMFAALAGLFMLGRKKKTN